MHFLHFGIIETTQRSRCLRHMRVSKVYPGNPVGIMHVWCLMGQVLGFTPLHLPLCLRQWRQGRPDGANAFVTQENHESVCAWRATVSILGNGFTCTCPCQDLKFWRFEVSVFLKTIMLRPFFGVFLSHVFLLHCVSAVLFWKILRLSGLCSHIEDAVLAHVVKGHPINCRPSLYFHSDPCFSFWSHLCVLSMNKRTVCICILWGNAQYVFAFYEHTMYLHTLSPRCSLSRYLAPAPCVFKFSISGCSQQLTVLQFWGSMSSLKKNLKMIILFLFNST